MTNEMWTIIGVNIGLFANSTAIMVYMLNRRKEKK
jgi:uncharacterized membrane protein